MSTKVSYLILDWFAYPNLMWTIKYSQLIMILSRQFCSMFDLRVLSPLQPPNVVQFGAVIYIDVVMEPSYWVFGSFYFEILLKKFYYYEQVFVPLFLASSFLWTASYYSIWIRQLLNIHEWCKWCSVILGPKINAFVCPHIQLEGVGTYTIFEMPNDHVGACNAMIEVTPGGHHYILTVSKKAVLINMEGMGFISVL